MSVRQVLLDVLTNYLTARTSSIWGKDVPMYSRFMHNFPDELKPVIAHNSHLRLKPSTGNGNWADVPWLAFLHDQETTQITRGVHAIYLFRADMSGVYLAVGLGITEFKEQFKGTWQAVVKAKVAELSRDFAGLAAAGFSFDPSGFDLRSKTQRGQSYGPGITAYKFYDKDHLPNDEAIQADLAAVLESYDNYVANRMASDVGLFDTPVVPDLPPDDDNEPDSSVSLADAVAHFAAALKQSHISFGAETHDPFVRSFMASLATKRFVILTGLSGSGKTQIALRLGEWFGSTDQDPTAKLVAVRPDWTGAEALFGYEDALLPAAQDGRRAWHVTDALAFMLKAARDPNRPYLLILDEMNLAHVERYFADVLSGMESDQPCLPNLHQEQGYWRLPFGGDKFLAFPRNLFVVGTVNVDETTYMFSPKVLDRANTFEFRVAATDLLEEVQKPTACSPGSQQLVKVFLQTAKDEQYHLDYPMKDRAVFAEHLRTVHTILAENGFEFGHRVFYEALRYAALMEAAGNQKLTEAFDRQVMQKVLPRLHGTRRRLEPTLCALGQFCATLTFDSSVRFDPEKPLEGNAALPLSFDKVRRMTKNVRINQFASFTE